MQECLFLQIIRYEKLFETAKFHVQTMKFTFCLNMALILSKPKSDTDLFGITLHIQGNALYPLLNILSMFLLAKLLRASLTLWRRNDVEFVAA